MSVVLVELVQTSVGSPWVSLFSLFIFICATILHMFNNLFVVPCYTLSSDESSKQDQQQQTAKNTSAKSNPSAGLPLPHARMPISYATAARGSTVSDTARIGSTASNGASNRESRIVGIGNEVLDVVEKVPSGHVLEEVQVPSSNTPSFKIRSTFFGQCIVDSVSSDSSPLQELDLIHSINGKVMGRDISKDAWEGYLKSQCQHPMTLIVFRPIPQETRAETKSRLLKAERVRSKQKPKLLRAEQENQQNEPVEKKKDKKRKSRKAGKTEQSSKIPQGGGMYVVYMFMH